MIEIEAIVRVLKLAQDVAAPEPSILTAEVYTRKKTKKKMRPYH